MTLDLISPGRSFHLSESVLPVPEKSKDDAVDFLSPTLSVTCGKAKGTLFLEELRQGECPIV